MTDPFSITAGTIGITGVALSGISKLRQTVTDWENAPQEVRDIESRLSSTQDTLKSLDGLKILDWTAIHTHQENSGENSH